MPADEPYTLDPDFQQVWESAGTVDDDPGAEPAVTGEREDDTHEPPASDDDTQDAPNDASDDQDDAAAGDESTDQDASDATDTDASDIPLAPITYKVDGEERTVAGLHAVGEDGAIVDKAALPDLLQRLSERDHYFAKSQQQFRQYQALEQLTSWTTTGVDGKEVTLTGPDAIEALRVSHGQLSAAVQVLGGLIDNPQQLIGLLQQDATGALTIDPEKVDYLATKIRLASTEAEKSVRGTLSQIRQTATQTASQQQVQAQAPQLLWQSADSVWGKEYPTLTADDKTFLQGQLPRYIRPASPEEVKSGQFQPNEPVLDYGFRELMAYTAKQRADSAKVATTTTHAARDNAARLAATSGRAPRSKSLPARDRRTGRFTDDTAPKQPRVTDLLRDGQFPDYASARAI